LLSELRRTRNVRDEHRGELPLIAARGDRSGLLGNAPGVLRRRRRRLLSREGVERRVLGEDRTLELVERLAGFDTELVDEDVPRVVVAL
jgi:hypothetical protein